MTLAKAVVTGSVYRAPEKRFTQNNVPVSSFVLNIGDREEMLLRVIAKRQSLDEVVSSLGKDDRVLVEGRLQITTVKNESGAERKVYEIDANSVEPISGTTGSAASVNNNADILNLPKEEDFAEEVINPEEVPF